uniref:Sorting nexin-12-like n=1 Tax=Sinocyclocheilus grahami TaxID=75366 RepID=A0A672K299_SINGR
MSEATVADTRRLNSKPQDLTDAYGPPSNFLEIDVYDPQTIGVGRNRFTTYEVRMKIVVPPLPGKALKRQLPFRGDEGIFEESFIEERRAGLEQFINRIAGHPLAQNERCSIVCPECISTVKISNHFVSCLLACDPKVLVNPPPPHPGPICSTSSFLHISQSLSQLLSMIFCIYFYSLIELQHLFHPEDELILMLYLYLMHSFCGKTHPFLLIFKQIFLSLKTVLSVFILVKTPENLIRPHDIPQCIFDLKFKS